MFDTYDEIIKQLAVDIDNNKLWQKALKHKPQSQIFIDVNNLIERWNREY